MPTITGDEGTVVTLEDAASFTSSYRSDNPGAIKAHTVGANKLNSILGQSGCIGVRMYYGIEEEGNKCLVLVGVNANGEDLTSGIIVERVPPCPPLCDDKSALNG